VSKSWFAILFLLTAACSSPPPPRAVTLGRDRAILVTQTARDHARQRAFVDAGSSTPYYEQLVLRGEVEVGMTADDATASWGLGTSGGPIETGRGPLRWTVALGGVRLEFEEPWWNSDGSIRLPDPTWQMRLVSIHVTSGDSDGGSSPMPSGDRAVLLAPNRAVLVTQAGLDGQRQRRFVEASRELPDDRREAILRGEVTIGMTEEEVRAAWGDRARATWSIDEVFDGRSAIEFGGLTLTYANGDGFGIGPREVRLVEMRSDP